MDSQPIKRSFGRKLLRFVVITIAGVFTLFCALAGFGFYLGFQQAAEKEHAAELAAIDPDGKMTPEQREKALADKTAADAVAKAAAAKAREEQRERERVEKERQEAAGREFERASREAEAARIKALGLPMDNASLIMHSWEAYGAVFVGRFSIVNRGLYNLKDPVIYCTLFGPSGTELGSVKETAYQTVHAKSTVRLKDLNMGFIRSQASQASCRLIGIERAS